MTTTICEKAMLASVSVKGIWSAVGEDKAASEDIANAKGIRRDIYRAIKHLLDPKQIKSLKDFNAARSTFYNLHRRKTLAWDDKQGRMLPNTMYFEYMQEMGEAKQKVIDTYNAFLNDIPGLKLRFQMDPDTAGAYQESDWPDVDELKQRVNIRMRITPLADVADFRVQLGAEEVDKIKAEYARDMQSNLASALAELIGDLKTVIENSRDSIGGYELDDKGKTVKTFKESAVVNIRNMVATARKLNVVGDATLTGLLDQIETSLCTHDAQALKDNHIIRKQVVSDAGALAQQLKSVEDVLCQMAEAA